MRLILLCTLVVALFVGCADKKPPAQLTANPEAGKKIAEKSCVGCHGLDGKGATDDIPNLAAQVQEYLVAAIQAYKEGKREHAALKDMASKLNDADTLNIAAYYAGQPPLTGEQKPMQDIAEKGKATAAVCANCHGEGGNSTTPGIPNLAGQQPVYFISAVKAYMDGAREMASKEKQGMMAALNQVDVEAMALYFASQTPAKRDAPSFGSVAAGEPLSANCGACHGASGISSDSKVPTLASQDPQYLVGAIKAYQERGRKQEDMHAFLSNISAEGIGNIAAYYSVQPAKPAEAKTMSMAELADKCDHCHGPGMENPMMIFPKIRGQNKGYLVKALRAYRDNKRGSSPMHKMSLPYSEAVIESIAAWYASQPAE
ncbi:c-type cytochrome [Kaarinaea lacus]